jgi:hypothetical protein
MLGIGTKAEVAGSGTTGWLCMYGATLSHHNMPAIEEVCTKGTEIFQERKNSESLGPRAAPIANSRLMPEIFWIRPRNSNIGGKITGKAVDFNAVNAFVRQDCHSCQEALP